MELPDLISLFVNNGTSIVVLAYFMYTQNSTQKELKKTIDELKELIKELILRIKEGGER